jgi:hypothetical protein
LPLYSKEVLTGMARVIVSDGGWSSLRKAELIELMIANLVDPLCVKRLVEDLHDEERAALGRVMQEGGAMSWQEFDGEYGNDLEESRYWNWHTPETIMGRLRLHGLVAEATVDGELMLVVPVDLREAIAKTLA